MARKTAHEAARAKAAREKKILAVLCIPLAVALFFAYHTVTKLHHSSAPTATPAAQTTPASTVAAETTPASTTPTDTTESSTGPAPDQISQPAPMTGKLTRFSLFPAQDPFNAHGPRNATSTTTPSSSTKTKTTKQKAPAPTSAVISVNGRLAAVTVGSAFPVTKDPSTNGVFRLVGLTAKSAKVAVVGGSYTSGSHALTLSVDSVVKLVNTADGKRFTLILYPQGTPAPGVPIVPPTSTTTTPPTTTTTG